MSSTSWKDVLKMVVRFRPKDITQKRKRQAKTSEYVIEDNEYETSHINASPGQYVFDELPPEKHIPAAGLANDLHLKAQARTDGSYKIISMMSHTL